MSINLIKKKNREGKIYVNVVEAYRDGDKVRHRYIKSYGQLDKLEAAEPGWFERMKTEVKTKNFDEEMKKELTAHFDLSNPLTQVSRNYGWQVLDAIFNFLEIKKVTAVKSRAKSDLTQVLKLLAFQRILAPASKLSTVQSQSDLTGDWNLSENDIYRGLDKLEALSSDIQLQMHQKISATIGRTATLVFYDVTNYYFETDLDDDFRRRGPSKEHRPNPIVQMGLFMDSKGIPISYQLFRGNQTDPVTYLPAIEQVKKQFGIERIVVVADKGMNSMKNISGTLAKGDGWLFSQKHRGLRGASKEIQAYILDSEGWQVNGTGTFAHKSMLHERKLEGGGTVSEKVLVTWNKAYDVREKARRAQALAYADKLTNAELFRQTAKRGGKKYLELKLIDRETGEVKPFKPHIQLDEDRILFDSQFDGINVLVTSEVEMSDEAMIEAYGELYKIEDCFRVTKTEFDARPVYVWTEAHIKAHFLTCFVALTLLRVLQNATNWEMSAGRLVGSLQSARSIELTKVYSLVEGNADFQALNRLLKTNWQKQIVTQKQLKTYAKDWCKTFFEQ